MSQHNLYFINQDHYVTNTLMLQSAAQVILQLLHSLETTFCLEDVCVLVAFGNEALFQQAFRNVAASIQQSNYMVALVSLIAFAGGSNEGVNDCLTSDGTPIFGASFRRALLIVGTTPYAQSSMYSGP